MIIFFDIDGTLISDGSYEIPESARKAIEKARENGHICMINTGRSRRLVGADIRNQVEFDGFLLGCGTMIEYHNEVIMHKTFSEAESRRIIEGVLKHGLDVVLEGPEDNYGVPVEEYKTATFGGYMRRYKGMYTEDIWAGLCKFDKFFGYSDELGRLQGFQEEFSDLLDFIDRENGFFEVVPKGCSKATTIYDITDRLGISMDETAAVGDSNNDLQMMQAVKYPIAMAKSSEEIIKIASYVTTDVHNDGIFNALKWLKVI